MKKKLLVIEDDPDIQNLVRINLSTDNHQVDVTGNGKEGFELAQSGQYDLIILDIMLPEMDGLQICTGLRSKDNLTPILMLTAKDSEADRVVGLEVGADDYLTKPFSIRELQARVKAMLRRMEMNRQQQKQDEELLTFGELSINAAKRLVHLKGEPITLTSTEFDLLIYLARNPGVVFSRSQLLDSVWGYTHSGYEHTVNSHINRLRTKLEVDPAHPQYVLTVWGVGYKFNDAL